MAFNGADRRQILRQAFEKGSPVPHRPAGSICRRCPAVFAAADGSLEGCILGLISLVMGFDICSIRAAAAAFVKENFPRQKQSPRKAPKREPCGAYFFRSFSFSLFRLVFI